MTLKEELHLYCQNFAQERILRIQNNIQGIQESLSSETKSSAGDKHETGRAMLQLEREKLGQQLAEAEKMPIILSKVKIENNSKSVVLGSLVKTSSGNYFLAISAGEFKNNTITVFCISMGTPIGQLLFGKSTGDSIHFRGNTLDILEII